MTVVAGKSHLLVSRTGCSIVMGSPHMRRKVCARCHQIPAWQEYDVPNTSSMWNHLRIGQWQQKVRIAVPVTHQPTNQSINQSRQQDNCTPSWQLRPPRYSMRGILRTCTWRQVPSGRHKRAVLSSLADAIKPLAAAAVLQVKQRKTSRFCIISKTHWHKAFTGSGGPT